MENCSFQLFLLSGAMVQSAPQNLPQNSCLLWGISVVNITACDFVHRCTCLSQNATAHFENSQKKRKDLHNNLRNMIGNTLMVKILWNDFKCLIVPQCYCSQFNVLLYFSLYNTTFQFFPSHFISCLDFNSLLQCGFNPSHFDVICKLDKFVLVLSSKFLIASEKSQARNWSRLVGEWIGPL